jgi:hypothetical protein
MSDEMNNNKKGRKERLWSLLINKKANGEHYSLKEYMVAFLLLCLIAALVGYLTGGLVGK